MNSKKLFSLSKLMLNYQPVHVRNMPIVTDTFDYLPTTKEPES